MNRDVMSVRLWLPRIRVLGVVVDAPERLAVRVASTVRRPRCPGCGTPSGRAHDRRDREVRDLEVSGRPVTLVFCQRRMVCGPCGRRFMEGHRAFEGGVTARLARRLVADAREMTVNAAAKRHRVGWGLVNALVVAWADVVADHRRRRRCRVLLVDETSIRKRHRYVTVLVNGDTGEVLAVVPHRDSAALSGFLAAQGPKWCRRVTVVVSDGSAAYKTAIEKRPGTRSASCTSSTSPKTAKAPWRRWTGSRTSTAPGRSPRSATPSTRSSPGMPRSSTGTEPGGPATDALKAPTTCSKCCGAKPTGSPTTPTSKPAACY